MATAVLSTLRHVSERKLGKLADQRKTFDEERMNILESIKTGNDPRDRIRALVESVERLKLKATGASVSNVRRFLDQSRHDPSVSSGLLSQWQRELERTLSVQGMKLQYADLFGRLVTEWIEDSSDGTRETLSSEVTYHQQPSHDSRSRQKLELPQSNSRRDSSGSESTTSFEHIGRAEMYEQRKQWESYALNEHKVDRSAIREYLQELFGSTSQTRTVKETPLGRLRQQMKKLDELKPPRFDGDVVRSCIEGLLEADLFSGSKREALVDLQSKSAVLSEMADMLRMDFDGLESWQWDPAPISLHMRRQLNGKYRVFMDEEVHQAVLVQFVGALWAKNMRDVFADFHDSDAWLQTPFRSMNKTDKAKREYYLSSGQDTNRTIRHEREEMYRKDYFMTQLPTRLFQDHRLDDYDGDGPSRNDDTNSGSATKQSMLRLATTEMLVNMKLYGEFTILQSDFKWFGPSLPHDTIFTVLEFFGVESRWLSFFRKYLETPLVFAQDGPDAEPRVRRRGIPMSHVLSTALGEAVLFCLDFAVNKYTQGQNLYRLHDDLWFWGQRSACKKAWKAMKAFADVMGLVLNEEKTGCTHMTEGEDVSAKEVGYSTTDKDGNGRANSLKRNRVFSPDSLPNGQVRWGFLLLDPKAGRWIIDMQKVDEHIDELQRQLTACRSVSAWIQAWNSYASRFFSTNFGQPANCFGQQHVDMVVETLEYIQRKLFASMNGTDDSVTAYLRTTIKERFGVDNVPDGFFYFPNILGGLELRNSFVPLLLIRPNSLSDPAQQIDAALELDQDRYEKFKERFESGDYTPPRSIGGWRPTKDDEFLSFEEFAMFPEETSYRLLRAYESLMEQPWEDGLGTTPEILRGLEALNQPADGFQKRQSSPRRVREKDDASKADWKDLQPYWNWIFELYAGEIIEKFGGLSMGEAELLPLGLVKMLRSEKVRWHG